MTIVAIDENLQLLKELEESLDIVFPQDTIAAFQSSLLTLRYVSEHPKEIGLVFSAMTMRTMDGITLAQCITNHAPGAAIFFVIEAENSELVSMAKQHGRGTCLSRPVTVESIRKATSFLQEPCPWEDEFCEKECCWEWCEHRTRKTLGSKN